MNRKLTPQERVSPPGEETARRIEEALKSIGTAVPEIGLEGRILTRVAAARINGEADSGLGLPLPGLQRRVPRFVFPVLGFASVGLVCAVVIGGSVRQPVANAARPAVAPPVLHLPRSGFGTASAVHPAAPASTPVPPNTISRGHTRVPPGHGRARIARHAHKAHGVAVPPPATTP